MPNLDNFVLTEYKDSGAVSEQERLVVGQNTFQPAIFGTVTPEGNEYVESMSARTAGVWRVRLLDHSGALEASAPEAQIYGFAVLLTDDEFAEMLCSTAEVFG